MSSNYYKILLLFTIAGKITKYHKTKRKELTIISKLIKIGISVYLVTNDSRNPAVIKIGIKPTDILSPSLAPFIKDSLLEKVLGKRILFPITIPAQPAITIAEISRVPCIQTTRIDSQRRLC